MQPLVSVIIVNWNGEKWLKNCLTSLYSQVYKNIEVILVDNASSDTSVNYVECNFPEVKLIKSNKNLGFAGGNNLGLEYSRGKYLFLLNSDTEVTENSILDQVKYMEQKESVAIIQSKLILLNDKSTYDIVGSFWTFTTMLYYFGSYGTVGEYIYEKELDVYTVKGAAVLIRKSVVDNIGLFDDDYWCYFEETDFCHRALLSGYEVKYVPLSPIYHAGGGSSLKFENSFVQYHNFKNKLCTYLKNFEFRRLTYVVPIHIVIVLFLSLYYLGGDRQKSLAMIKSLWWNVKNIRETYKKRKIVQNHRKRNDKDYLKKITINPKLYYYYCLLTNIKKYAKLY